MILVATPNLSQKQRSTLYPQVQAVWPEVCANCNKTLDQCNLKPFDPRTMTGGFELHHIRYDLGMTEPRVVRFMCHSCNHREEFSKQVILEHENELSASHKANLQKHPIFLAWFSNEMVENNYHMPLSEVINGGAWVSGANVKTVQGWLKPLAYSKQSPFAVVAVLGVDTVYLRGKESRLELPSRTIADFNDAVDDSFHP